MFAAPARRPPPPTASTTRSAEAESFAGVDGVNATPIRQTPDVFVRVIRWSWAWPRGGVHVRAFRTSHACDRALQGHLLSNVDSGYRLKRLGSRSYPAFGTAWASRAKGVAWLVRMGDFRAARMRQSNVDGRRRCCTSRCGYSAAVARTPSTRAGGLRFAVIGHSGFEAGLRHAGGPRLRAYQPGHLSADSPPVHRSSPSSSFPETSGTPGAHADLPPGASSLGIRALRLAEGVHLPAVY